MAVTGAAHVGDRARPCEPEEAVRAGDIALELVEGLQSKRALSYLRRLQHRLRPHERLPEVEGFNARARTFMPG